MSQVSATTSEARRVIENEAKALAVLSDNLPKQFDELIDKLLQTSGHVVVIGMGKSGWIAQKICATFNSTGTKSIFLHPSEALHGDLGIVKKTDFVIAFSHSGETQEMLKLLPYIRRSEIPMAAVTNNGKSSLARLVDIVVDYPMASEACPLELAPMTSTTLMLALGDAIASCLMVKRGFTREDFGQNHPSGSLGKEVVAEVGDVMLKDDLPVIDESATLDALIALMVGTNVGAAVVVKEGKLTGIISDGDIKRLLSEPQLDMSRSVTGIMTADPKTVTKDVKLKGALELMKKKKIYILPVVAGSDDMSLVGLLRMHDILAYNP